jgi:hypothetical protein
VLDPLRDVFGQPSTELFHGRELVVSHGELERFPAFMHHGPMESIESLCKRYVGNLEVAKGSVVEVFRRQ